MSKKPNLTRNYAICRDRYKGDWKLTNTKLAEKWGVSRQRIETILKKYYDSYIKKFIKRRKS